MASLCEEVAKLKIERRRGEVIATEAAGAGGNDGGDTRENAERLDILDSPSGAASRERGSTPGGPGI